MKAAILIDGGYFLKRLGSVRPNIDATDPVAVARGLMQLVDGHLVQLARIHGVATDHRRSLLYRAFFYDAKPYARKAHRPVSKNGFSYDTTDAAKFRRGLFEELRKSANFAVRLGQVVRDRDWVLKKEP